MDHRDLNRDLDIFTTDPLAGAGLPMWQPDGAVIRAELERLARELALEDGCQPVATPVLGKKALYERSGHWSKFADDMFPAMRVGGDELVLRPANCPHHALLYGSTRHSYRELPIRYNELGAMFRAERSGVLSGLARVRQINLDDTHVFCRPDQVRDEVTRALRLALRAQEILGLPVDDVRLSLRDDSPSYLGDPVVWSQTEDALRGAAAEVLGHPPTEAPGEAAIYGPKLDLQMGARSAQESGETIATVQLDFVQPERFDLTYDAADGSADGSRRPRVVMIHRGTVGSMERVTAALLEHYQGRLPLWLAPVQVEVLPVSTDQDAPARALADELRAIGLRPRFSPDGTLGARIRDSRRRRVPLLAVIGPAEVDAGAVQVKDVAAGRQIELDPSDLGKRLRLAYESRSHDVGVLDSLGA